MTWVSDLLKEYPALSVAKERLEYLQDKFNDLKEINKKLELENEKLKLQNDELKGKIVGDRENSKFIEIEGVLFKKKDDGNIENCCYCPKCKLAMTAVPLAFPQSLQHLKV